MPSSSLPTIAQKISVHKNLSFLSPQFTTPTFQTFLGIVRSLLKNRTNGTLAQFSSDIHKCISAIGYFFTSAQWDANSLKQRFQKHLLHSSQTTILDGDIASIDGSPISKKGDTFEFIGDVWDNAEKRLHSGYEILACAIISPKRQSRWLFDFICCSNRNPQFRGLPIYVKRLLRRLFTHGKNITTVLFDAGFKNQYLLSYVLKQRKNFIIRAIGTMHLWTQETIGLKGGSIPLNEIRRMPNAQYVEGMVNGEQGWSVTWTSGILNAWRREINTPLTVVVVKNPAFRKPLVLVTSLPIRDASDAFNIYQTYLLRWKIEQIFQSIKELGLEKFRVRSWKAIVRYITILWIVHNLLTWLLIMLHKVIKFRNRVKKYLRKKRKIHDVLIGGLKIFFEHYLQKSLSLTDLFSHAF